MSSTFFGQCAPSAIHFRKTSSSVAESFGPPGGMDPDRAARKSWLSSGRFGTMTIIARSLRLRRKCFMAVSAPWQRTQRISRIGLTSRTKSTLAISGRETNSNVEAAKNAEIRIGLLYGLRRRMEWSLASFTAPLCGNSEKRDGGASAAGFS